jgi:thiamine pyrophosphate-dependent acetolactate synthase large subunit-like protein
MPDVAQYMLGRLRERGIERVYGYPGDGIDGEDSIGTAKGIKGKLAEAEEHLPGAGH